VSEISWREQVTFDRMITISTLHYKDQLKKFDLLQSGYRYHPIECNLFSPWYFWHIAYLTLIIIPSDSLTMFLYEKWITVLMLYMYWHFALNQEFSDYVKTVPAWVSHSEWLLKSNKQCVRNIMERTSYIR
jgi:hypothetical protein